MTMMGFAQLPDCQINGHSWVHAGPYPLPGYETVRCTKCCEIGNRPVPQTPPQKESIPPSTQLDNRALDRIAVALEHIRAMMEVLGPEIVKIANPLMTGHYSSTALDPNDPTKTVRGKRPKIG